MSAISWRSVLLMEETEVFGENNRQTLSHNVVSSTPPLERGSNSQLLCRQTQIARVVVNLTTKLLRRRWP